MRISKSEVRSQIGEVGLVTYRSNKGFSLNDAHNNKSFK